MDKKRIPYLDVAKGIGILLVVAGHIYGGENFGTILYAFHVPLFIVISGMLIQYTKAQEQTIWNVAKKKCKSLIVPYILTEIIVLPLYMIKYGHGLSDLHWNIIDSLILYNTKGIATWFLLHLFFAELIYLCIIKGVKKGWIIQIISIILFILSFVKIEGHYAIVLMQKNFNFVFFLMVGHQYFSKVKKWKSWTLLLIFPFVLSALQNECVVMAEAVYHKPILYVLSAILGIAVTFCVSHIIALRFKVIEKFFVFWGRNSLFILCTHLLITRYGIDLIWVDGPHYESIVKSVCVFLLVLGLEWILIKLKERFKKREVKNENSCICSN